MTTLGIDLGTGSVKVALVADDGTVRALSRAGYAVDTPHPGWAESDPGAWLAATRDAVLAVANVAREERLEPPAVVGFSGQMHGVVAVDAELAPLRPAIVWADTRSVAQAARLGRDLGADALGRLGSPAVPGFAGPTLAWLRDAEPATAAAARWFLQPKDWLRAVLGGAVATDRSDASGTLMYDVEADVWSATALHAIGVAPAQLPAVLPSHSPAGTVTLPGFGTLPAVVGGADTACAIAGLGLGDEATMIAVGSGAQVVRTAPEPVPDASMRTHLFARTGAAGDGWYRLGAVQSAGLVLTHALAWFGATEVEAEAALAQGAREDDPMFVPYLAGERTPFMDPTLTGSLLGLTLSTERSAVLRSLLEAIAQAVALAADAVRSADGRSSDLPAMLIGGGARGPAFAQLLSDATGLVLAPSPTSDAAVVGAALLAAGLTTNPRPAATGQLIEPDPHRAQLLLERRERMVQYVRAEEAP